MKYIFTQFPCDDMTTEEFLILYQSWDESVKEAKKKLDAELCGVFTTNRCKSAMMRIKQMVDDGIEFEKEKKRERKILNKKTPKQIRTESKRKKLLIDKKRKKQRTKRNLDFVTVITEKFSYICDFASIYFDLYMLFS